MKIIKVATKAGTMVYVPVFNKAFEHACENGTYKGLCIACGKTCTGVEPDAHHYTCSKCGAAKVFGLEELVLRGLCR